MVAESPDAVDSLSPRTKPVVLCVDDDHAVLSSLRRLFRGEPYDVLTANNAAQALAALRARRIELIISDERMPLMSGSEFLAEVRQRWPGIARVILTAYPAEPASQGPEIEADLLLQKPWDDEWLKRTVRRIVRDAVRSRSEDTSPPPFEMEGEEGRDGRR